MKALTTTIARFVFALPFLIFGLFHFMNTSDMTGMVPGWLPGGAFWVILTGLALIGASVSIMIRVWDYWATLLLALMLILFVLFVHLPGATEGDQNAMTSLLKDTALAGASLLYAGYVSRSK